MPEPVRCTGCNHFRGSHIRPDGGCIVERISGPASVDAPTIDNPHPGRVVEVCECKEFIDG